VSAILETEPGGELVCIETFSVSPHERVGPRSRRQFRVGERVRYITYYQDDNLRDNPAGWMVVFRSDDPGDLNRYASTQTSFVTIDCWETLKKYFAKGLMSEPQRLISKQTSHRQESKADQLEGRSLVAREGSVCDVPRRDRARSQGMVGVPGPKQGQVRWATASAGSRAIAASRLAK